MLSAAIRYELVTLARRKRARVTEFRRDRPTDWRPSQVQTPDGNFDNYFTEASAWEYIASKLENGHPVEIIELRKPPGAKGYVMQIEIEPSKPRLYIKLQLTAGKIIGRSFHYSNKMCQ